MIKTAAEKSKSQEVKTFKDGSRIFEYGGEYYTAVDEYGQQALVFLLNIGTTLKVFLSHTGPHFEGEESKKDIYNITLQNKKHAYTFTFGDSIYNSEARVGDYTPYNRGLAQHQFNKAALKKEREHRAPGAYDILTCLTKYDPDTFANFCDEFGYDVDSISHRKVYFAIQEEWNSIRKLFTPKQLEDLGEIQ